MKAVTRSTLLASSAAVVLGGITELASGDSTLEDGSENLVVPIVSRVVSVSEASLVAEAEASGEVISVPRRDTLIGPPQIGDRVVIEELPDGSRRFGSPLYTPINGVAHIDDSSILVDGQTYPLDPGAIAVAGDAPPVRVSEIPPSTQDLPAFTYAIDQNRQLRIAAIFPSTP